MTNRISEKIGGGWIFFIIVAIFYLILLSFNFPLGKDAFIKFFELLQKIIPVFILVFIFIFISNLFLDAKKIAKFIGESAGIKGWFVSIAAGILSMGPIYMWYPLLADLKEKGMKESFIAVFLYNRAIKIPLLPLMIYYFGLTFVIILTFYMILFSIINGLLVDKLLKFKKPII